MRSFKRSDRVGELVSEEVSRIIQFDLKDPGLGFVTVTGVEMGQDLKRAVVYVSVYGDEEQGKKSIEALERASGYIRREMGRKINLKYTPELSFRHDPTREHASRIETLIRQIHNEGEEG